jgi:uncharacterized protein (DUF2147 family)
MRAFNLFLSAGLLLAFAMTGTSQTSPVGLWKTVDDETGEEKSYVEIFERNGKLYGKVTRLLLKPADTVCDQCPGDKKNKPLIGMEILWNLEPYKDYWSYGYILDPVKGKTYKCSIWLENKDELKLRGYIGVSAVGRTQTWKRVR